MPSNNGYKQLGFSRSLVSQEEAAMIERPDIPRSTFMGSWSHLTTFNVSELIPFLVDEVLPGDHLRYQVNAYLRIATLLFPQFSNLQVYTFFFFVPARILWENWTKMNGELPPTGETPDDYVIPQIQSDLNGFQPFTLADYFGLPTEGQTAVGEQLSVNALPFRAYNMIWNEWFRDQNIQQKLVVDLDDATVPDTFYQIRHRNKAHDYFTSALPWPQKFVAPPIPLLGQAPITGLGVDPSDSSDRVWTAGGGAEFLETSGQNVAYPFLIQASESTVGFKRLFVRADAGLETSPPEIFADLTQATGVSINALRQAFLIQQLLERDARGGTRYVEILKSHFGVTSPDYRLQRPEYIGGGSSPMAITPIAQTAPSEDQPVGYLGAAGTGVAGHSADYAATEHGYIIGLINIRSELLYQQGLHKMWSRRTRYDFYLPALAGLGEQAVLRKEIFCNSVAAEDELVFGYQERWHEYRTRTSFTSGYFRSYATNAIDQWHLGQDYAVAPVLDTDFIEDNPPISRVLAAGDLEAGKQFLADILIRRTATRPLPMFGTPVTLGRF